MSNTKFSNNRCVEKTKIEILTTSDIECIKSDHSTYKMYVQTPNMDEFLIEKNPLSIQYIENQTLQLKIKAVEGLVKMCDLKNFCYLIDEIPEQIQIYIIKQCSVFEVCEILQIFGKNQTEKVQMIALEKCGVNSIIGRLYESFFEPSEKILTFLFNLSDEYSCLDLFNKCEKQLTDDGKANFFTKINHRNIDVVYKSINLKSLKTKLKAINAFKNHPTCKNLLELFDGFILFYKGLCQELNISKLKKNEIKIELNEINKCFIQVFSELFACKITIFNDKDLLFTLLNTMINLTEDNLLEIISLCNNCNVVHLFKNITLKLNITDKIKRRALTKCKNKFETKQILITEKIEEELYMEYYDILGGHFIHLIDEPSEKFFILLIERCWFNLRFIPYEKRNINMYDEGLKQSFLSNILF